MAILTDYLENKIIDWLWRGQSFTPPATMYVALFTDGPLSDDAGGGVTEVTGGSYARVAVTSNTTNWDNTQLDSTTAVSSGTDACTQNNGNITFPAPTANWGTVTHFGLADASTAGNLLFIAPLDFDRLINNGDAAPMFPAGSLYFQLDT